MSFYQTRGQLCRLCGGKIQKRRLRCPECRAWNAPKSSVTKSGDVDDGTILLSEAEDRKLSYYTTGPWDINFCHSPPGVPSDSVTLIAGAPGAGKSTLALQLTEGLASSSPLESLYIGAEESKAQVKARAIRLRMKNLTKIRMIPLEKMGDVSLSAILEGRRFSGVVLDSIARFANSHEEQIEIVKALKEYAVQYNTPFLVINHITKGGDMAGTMALQHEGDISLMLTKWERNETGICRPVGSSEWLELNEIRELYTDKSRYGQSGIVTSYAMTEYGLCEVEIRDDEADDSEDDSDE